MAKEVQNPQASEPKFSLEKLGENCRALFGISSTHFAGATHGLTGEYTVEEMRKHIGEWDKREVK